MWLLITTALASPWIPETGVVRASLGLQQLVTARQFANAEAEGRVGPLCPDGVSTGDRAPYDCTTGGSFTNRSAYLDFSATVADHLAIDLFVPVVLDAAFADDLGTTRARGLGDLRLGARYTKQVGAVAIAGALHAKAPTGPAGLVDRDVPLGDAQWDVIPGLRIGTSLHPWGWLELHNQLVIRFKSARSGIDPGEEWTGSLGGGFTPVKWGGVQIRGEWIAALADTDGFGLKHPGRKLLQVRGGPFVRSEQWWAELTIAAPIVGQRWPTAPALGMAVSRTFL